MITEELKVKHRLITSQEWRDIRLFLLNEIENLAASDIDPIELKGMLRTIKMADGWESKYQTLLKNEELNNGRNNS